MKWQLSFFWAVKRSPSVNILFSSLVNFLNHPNPTHMDYIEGNIFIIFFLFADLANKDVCLFELAAGIKSFTEALMPETKRCNITWSWDPQILFLLDLFHKFYAVTESLKENCKVSGDLWLLTEVLYMCT